MVWIIRENNFKIYLIHLIAYLISRIEVAFIYLIIPKQSKKSLSRMLLHISIVKRKYLSLNKFGYQLNLRKFGNFKIHFDCFLFLRNRKKYFAVVLCSVDTKRKWRCRGGGGHFHEWRKIIASQAWLEF